MKKLFLSLLVVLLPMVAMADAVEIDGIYLYIFCLAEKVPSAKSDVFPDSSIGNAILYVPSVSISAYRAAVPWKNFKSIVALDGSETPRDALVGTVLEGLAAHSRSQARRPQRDAIAAWR